MALDINEPGLMELSRDNNGRALHCERCDVSDANDVRDSVAAALAHFGRLDGIVHSAYWTRPKPALETSEDDWRRTWDVCVTGAFLLARCGLPAMLSSGGGVIVPIASGQSFVGVPGFFAYQVAKAALLGFTRSIAVDYGPTVRCVAIAPGAIDSPALADAPEGMRATLAGASLAKRLGRPEDIARSAVFLLSDESSFITGTCIVVDGGYTSV
jgi:NAD(P)-dependent dehydrogenase (short-subunit alcohol dehydrogenase family)